MTIPQVGFQYEVESETEACSCLARTGKPYNLTVSLLLLNADRYTDAAFFGFHEHKTKGWQHCREGIKDAQYDDPDSAPGRAALAGAALLDDDLLKHFQRLALVRRLQHLDHVQEQLLEMDADDVDQDEIEDTIEEYKTVQTELLIAIEEDPQVAAVARKHLLSALAENTELPAAEDALMVARAVTSKPVSTATSGI